jgi:predicted small secreted protein
MQIKFTLYIFCLFLLASCNRNTYSTNGETIYRTGKNISGESLLNRDASRIKIVNSCRNCHGKDGEAMKGMVLKFSWLSDSANFSVPYTDSLFYRFLDHDLKSDGSKANIGVIWQMSYKDKKDLLDYLKTL